MLMYGLELRENPTGTSGHLLEDVLRIEESRVDLLGCKVVQADDKDLCRGVTRGLWLEHLDLFVEHAI